MFGERKEKSLKKFWLICTSTQPTGLRSLTLSGVQEFPLELLKVSVLMESVLMESVLVESVLEMSVLETLWVEHLDRLVGLVSGLIMIGCFRCPATVHILHMTTTHTHTIKKEQYNQMLW